jgi:hypothetical protein
VVARLSCSRADECDVHKVRKIDGKTKQLIGLADVNVVKERKYVNEIAAHRLSAATSVIAT